MSRSHSPSEFASDQLADSAERLAEELLVYKDARYGPAEGEPDRLAAYSAELSLLAELLRRSPVAQQRIAEKTLTWRRAFLERLRRGFDA